MKRGKLVTALIVLFSTVVLGQTAHAASITVTQLTDRFDVNAASGCSLREAIESVNLGNPFNDGCMAEFSGTFSTDPLFPDVINLIADEYVLSVNGNNEDDNASGDLDVRIPVDIIGAGSLETTITASGLDPNQKDRVIDFACQSCAAGFIDFLAPATLSGMTIRDGDVRDIPQVGGGIRSSLFLLTLDEVIVTENFAADGGGIFSGLSALVVLNSQILNNEAIEGGGIWSGEAFLVIDSSTVAGNTSSGSGGGIFNAGPATITNSTISGNQTIIPPNGIQGTQGFGGGIADFFNQIFIINSTISGNTAIFGGGGIAFLGVGGGSIDGAGGSPFLGGLFNVTIARNIVTFPDNGRGGGICNFCFQNGSATEVDGTGFQFPIANTLIAQNQAALNPDCWGDFTGEFFSAGFNLIGDIGNAAACLGFPNDPTNKVGGNNNPVIDPMITDLQNNGGPTDTHGLLQGSMAIDMGDPSGCMAPSVPSDVLDLLNNGPGPLTELLRDQRNFPRPIDGDEDGTPICDIGAFEFQIFSFELTKTDDTGGAPVPVGDNFNYIITVTNNGPGSASNVTLDDPLPPNVDFVSVTPSQGACAAIGDVIGCDLGDLDVGETATVTVTVTAVTEGTFTNIVTLTLNNPSQQTLTETAQVTTTIGGALFVFGSGIHCGLSPLAPAADSLKGLVLLAVILSAGLTGWRRRIQ